MNPLNTKIRVQVSLDKISKDKINKFKRKDGTEGATYEFDLVPVETEMVFENDNFSKTKIAFGAENTKKDDPNIYVGEAYVFESKEQEGTSPDTSGWDN